LARVFGLGRMMGGICIGAAEDVDGIGSCCGLGCDGGTAAAGRRSLTLWALCFPFPLGLGLRFSAYVSFVFTGRILFPFLRFFSIIVRFGCFFTCSLRWSVFIDLGLAAEDVDGIGKEVSKESASSWS
jgi:hypothetical protein